MIVSTLCFLLEHSSKRANCSLQTHLFPERPRAINWWLWTLKSSLITSSSYIFHFSTACRINCDPWSYVTVPLPNIIMHILLLSLPGVFLSRKQYLNKYFFIYLFLGYIAEESPWVTTTLQFSIENLINFLLKLNISKYNIKVEREVLTWKTSWRD